MAQLSDVIATASGRKPAELVLKNGYVLNVFNGKIEKADVAITGGVICGVGSDYVGIEQIDLTGKYVMPSFIDAHMHLESTQIAPTELAKLVVPHGTGCIIADPHEIANAAGFAGIDYIRASAEGLPLDVKLMLPSCVPAAPFEDSGATIDSEAFSRHLKDFFGVGEFMNFTGVTAGDAECLKKLEAAHLSGKPIDGHACGLSGKPLQAYAAAGINTEHECTTLAEAEEKLAAGIYIALRYGSSAKNLPDLIGAVTAQNAARFLMCSDDKRITDLKSAGHIDDNIRTSIKCGLDPVVAVTIATLNAAICYGLKGKGAIAPSYDADIAVVDNLSDFNVLRIFKGGKVVAENGKALFEAASEVPQELRGTVRIKSVGESDFRLPIKGNKAVVIALKEDTLVTDKEILTVATENGAVDIKSCPELNKIAVIERHNASGKMGVGLLKNYGLKNAAIAITVSHDSHNLIVAGDNDRDMAAAVAEIEKIGGGLTIVANEKPLKSLPFQIAGLMSTESADEAEKHSAEMDALAHAMGVNPKLDPFTSLSFLALPVIPEIKITARGLYDVGTGKFISIEPEN